MTRGDIPTKMRAAAIDHFGSPDVVHIDQLPVPRLAQHDVLVRVAIAGVGTWDPDLVSGSYEDVEAKFPRVLGSDGAGTVVAVGAKVKRFAVGDRVYGWGYANKKGGFFAEYAVLDEKKLATIPEGVKLFGASGGLGHIAIQLAKAIAES